jgi:methyl-accepting chemotaxis protein
MGWLKDLKVMHKILLLVVLAVIGMLIIGYTGYSRLQMAQADMHVMYAQHLKAVEYLGDARTASRRVQARMAEMVLASSPEKIQACDKAIQAAVKEYEDAWGQYEQLEMNRVDTSGQLQQVKQDWLAYKKVPEHLLPLVRSGNHDAAVSLYEGEGRQTLEKIRDDMSQLQKTINAAAGQVNEANEASMQRAGVLMLGALLLGVGLMLLFSFLLGREITGPLQKMQAFCHRLKDGDFRITPRTLLRGDEFGAMADVMADMRESLNKLMKHMRESTEHIASSSEELTASSMQSAQAAMQVAQSVTDSAHAVEEQQNVTNDSNRSIEKISVSVGNIRQEADKVARHSAEASQQAVAGNNEVDRSVEQIRNVENTVLASAELVEKLGGRSQEIGAIVDTIAGIAGQTNLLALNAAIEAARAGEAGRGFAVVAEEVRKLAEQSQTAAQQIADLISAIQRDTTGAVDSMQQGRAAVAAGARSVEELRNVFGHIRELVDGVSEQAGVMMQAISVVTTDTAGVTQNVATINAHGKKVVEEMQSVSAATEEQSASAEEIASASDALAKLAEEMQGSLKSFQY